MTNPGYQGALRSLGLLKEMVRNIGDGDSCASKSEGYDSQTSQE
jgi:hypothetical protein